MNSPGLQVLMSSCVPSYMKINVFPIVDGLNIHVFNPVISKGMDIKVPHCDGACVSEERWIDIVVPKLNKAVEKLQMAELELQEEDE